MVRASNCFLFRIFLVVCLYTVPSTCYTITQKINDLSKSLILDKTVSNCIHQTVMNRNYQQSKELLNTLSKSVHRLKYDIIEPLTNQNRPSHKTDLNYFNIYTELKHIIDDVKSIQCKKKIKKKGVMKKIKKFMTTEEPAAVKEEKEILESYEDFDGWTYEHLQLMKQYYAEIQKELAEIRELCPY